LALLPAGDYRYFGGGGKPPPYGVVDGFEKNGADAPGASLRFQESFVEGWQAMNRIIKILKWVLAIICACLCLIAFIGEFFPHMNGVTFFESNLPQNSSILSYLFSLLLIGLPLINAALFLMALRVRGFCVLAAFGALIFGFFFELPIALIEMTNGLVRLGIGSEGVIYTLGIGHRMVRGSNNTLFYLSLLFIVLLLIDFIKFHKDEERRREKTKSLTRTL